MITTADLASSVAELKAYIDRVDAQADKRNLERFEAVNDRLDRVNGNLGRHDREIAAAAVEAGRTDQKVVNLEREVFRNGGTPRGRVTVTDAVDEDAAPALTRGDFKRAAAGATAFATIVLALAKLWSFASSLFTHKP